MRAGACGRVSLLEEVPAVAPALAAARDIVATTARHAPAHANVDPAPAVLTASSGMSSSAGETVFAVPRTAGVRRGLRGTAG